MNKKWILILIIFIVGCSCLYCIIDSSTTVGNAITVVNKSVVTLPDDFTIGDDGKSSATLINENTDEKIYIEDLGKIDISKDCFENKLESLLYSYDTHIINHETLNINNITAHRIDIQNYTDYNNTTIVYTFTANHTFYITFDDYKDVNELNQDLNFIISAITPDFKQNQD